MEQGIVCWARRPAAGCGAKCVKAGVPCRGCYGPPAGARPGSQDGFRDRRRDRLDRSGGDRGDHRHDPRHDGDLLSVQPSAVHSPQEAGASMKTITIDPITRLEGHGKIHLFLNDDGGLANAYFQVPELRGFEVFCRDRPSRRCRGSRRASAASALRRTTWPRRRRRMPSTASNSAARGVKLRELMYNGFYAGDHTTHFYALGGPDFVCRPRRAEGGAEHPGRDRQGRSRLGAKVIAAAGPRAAGRSDHRRQGASSGDRPSGRNVEARHQGRAAGADQDRCARWWSSGRRRSRSSTTSCWRIRPTST